MKLEVLLHQIPLILAIVTIASISQGSTDGNEGKKYIRIN